MQFNITPKVIGYALHRILVSEGVSVGCSIPLLRLMELWPNSLLRSGDLATGITSLSKNGHLRLESSPEGSLVRLLNEQFSLIETADDREALAMLKRVRDVRKRPVSFVSNLVHKPRANLRRRQADQRQSAAATV